jgi:4-diphosphocytidyl-2-C-methyl-D-erythritol kinase
MAGKKLLRVHAPAKINLSLRVLGDSPDGYHELRTVFQSIALHDTLTFEERPGPFRIICDDPTIPCDETNLVWRAAEAIARAAGGAGAPRDITIHLTKRIPVRAGLGGGSSDAAAVLRGFAALWHVRIPRERMRAIAEPLGADVPFFLEGGAALGLRTGALLFPLADQPPAWVTLVIPPFGVTTKDAYAWFDEDGGSVRGQTGVRPGSDPGLTPQWSLPESGNDLEPPVSRRHPEIEHIADSLRRAGAGYAAMSGSGSAVFGLFPTQGTAARAARRLSSRGAGRAIVTAFVNRLKYQALAGL